VIFDELLWKKEPTPIKVSNFAALKTGRHYSGKGCLITRQVATQGRQNNRYKLNLSDKMGLVVKAKP
jgi:hypothetical protein